MLQYAQLQPTFSGYSTFSPSNKCTHQAIPPLPDRQPASSIMRCCCCTHIGRGLVFREFSFSLSTICFSSWRNNNERRAIEVPPSIEHMIAFLKLNTSNHRRVKSYAGTHMLLTADCWGRLMRALPADLISTRGHGQLRWGVSIPL